MLPLSVLKDNVQQERDKTADMSSFVEAIANDLVKSTLGPKLMEKILFNAAGDPQNVQVTNDGATTSKFIGGDNPAAKIPMSMAQDTEVGDGTTSVTVLASELLREAEKLIEMHFDPQSIISGYKIGLEIAKKALRDASNESTDTFKDDLLRIARTTLSSKILSQHKEHFAKLAVDAVLRLKGSGDLDAVQIIKKLGASMEDSYLDEGFLLEKKPGMYQPQRVENAKILIANTPMDTDKFKVFASRVDSLPKDTEFEAAEKKKMKDKVNKIIDLGINIFINRQRIYNYSEQLFADAKVMAIEHADFEGLERLALVLGGEIVSTFDTPEAVKFGKCDLIEKVIIGEDEFLRFSGVQKGNACSIVLRGSTQRILDEAERSLHDALCILISHIRHGGASEALMAAAVLREAQKVASGNESIAVEAFGRVLLQLPTITCDNAGLDSAELISHIHAEHVKGNHILNRPLDGVELKILEWKSLHLQIDRERKKETNLLAANGFTATDFAKAKEDVLHKGTPEGVMPIDIYDSAYAIESGYEPLILKLNLMEATSQQLQDCIRENIENEPC